MINALTAAILYLVSPNGITQPHFSNAPLGARHRAESLATTFTIAADKHGVDVALLVALAHWESGLNDHAVSSAGAMTIMQLLPRWHRETIGFCRRHPELCSVAAINRGAQVLARYRRQTPSDEAAIRAYRLGHHVPIWKAKPERVERARKVLRTRAWIARRLGHGEAVVL